MDPGIYREPANVYGRASVGALTTSQMTERLVDEVGFHRREASEIVGEFFHMGLNVALDYEGWRLKRRFSETPPLQ